MSSKPIIQIHSLGKKYLLKGSQVSHEKSLREFLASWYKRPFQTSDTEFWALRDFNYTIYPGETIGIIGSNGSGKSTLLKLLSRITRPTTGAITIFGRISALLEVGTGFHLELTGRENIFLSGAMLGMKRSEIVARFDEIVSFSGIEKFLDTPVKRYSSGMFLRLAFSVMSHLKNDILILDEILAVGDTTFQAQCLAKMKEIMREGRTILFVSHELSKIEALCAKTVWIKEGRLFDAGPTQEALTRYRRQMENSSNSLSASPQLSPL